MEGWSIRCCDNLDEWQGIPALASQGIDHVITDPPFEAEAHTQQRRVKRGGGVMEVEPLPFEPMSADLRKAVASQIARVVRRWVLVFCQIEASHLWAADLEAAGLVYKRTCIWVKPDGMPQYSGDRPGMGYETIVACHTKGKSHWNGGGMHGVFRVNKNDPRNKTSHQTRKPLALMELLVRLFTAPGDSILDPYAGSGTTIVAAKRLGRNGLGFEIDATYAAEAAARLGEYAEQLEFAPRKPKHRQLRFNDAD
jgi:site-specific DNA-methyltransferase (adenine-specific)